MKNLEKRGARVPRASVLIPLVFIAACSTASRDDVVSVGPVKVGADTRAFDPFYPPGPGNWDPLGPGAMEGHEVGPECKASTSSGVWDGELRSVSGSPRIACMYCVEDLCAVHEKL